MAKATEEVTRVKMGTAREVKKTRKRGKRSQRGAAADSDCY
jgi:hypothetical protein